MRYSTCLALVLLVACCSGSPAIAQQDESVHPAIRDMVRAVTTKRNSVLWSKAIPKVEFLMKNEPGKYDKDILRAMRSLVEHDNRTARELMFGAAARIVPLMRTDDAKQLVFELTPLTFATDRVTRQQALYFLAHVASRTKDDAMSTHCISVLITNVGSEDDSTRETAMGCLARLGPKAKDAIPVIVPLLFDKSALKRFYACLILGEFGPLASEALPALSDRRLNDSIPRVRDAAKWAITKIKK